MATRKFKIFLAMMLVVIIASVCAIGLVWSDIQQRKAILDNLYWIEEHEHAVPAGTLIKLAEADLRKRQMVLTSLIVTTIALVILTSVIMVTVYHYQNVVRKGQS